jgi:hypothetical protein
MIYIAVAVWLLIGVVATAIRVHRDGVFFVCDILPTIALCVLGPIAAMLYLWDWLDTGRDEVLWRRKGTP